jgi:ferric-dicitrate binding protein FerR (iron transport regulator)
MKSSPFKSVQSVKSVALIAALSSAITASAVSHADFGRLDGNRITAAPTRLTVTLADGSSVIRGESRLTASDYLAQGWKRVIDEAPAPSATNRYVYATGWKETDTEITRQYAEADIPAPIKVPRKFSKLKIYGAIAQLGAWDKVKSWLESKDVGGINGWTAFTLAQEVSESHELFATLAEEARQLLGLDEAAFNAMLDECVLEEN